MAYYYRRDDWVANAVGQALPDAQVWICSQPASATTVPPSPLVSVFSDSSGTATTFPLITDGFGHADCYVASGIYTVVYYHPAIGIVVQPDQFIGLGAAPPAGGVQSVTATLPLTSSGGSNPNLDANYHGDKAAAPHVQLSDNTGTSGHLSKFDANGALTDGPGEHGNAAYAQLSDNTGTLSYFPVFDANGNLTNGMAPSYDIVAFVPGIPASSQNLLHYNAVRGVSFPVNMTGSICNSAVAATGSTTINVNKNGLNVGTIIFSPSGTTGAFTVAGGMTLAATDYLDFVVVAADGTLSDVSFTLKGVRTS